MCTRPPLHLLFACGGGLMSMLMACTPERHVSADPLSAGESQRTTVVIKGRRFDLEVAATPQAQERGLGGRTAVGPRAGMLFVFTEPERQSFVMRDCIIPIDILYLDKVGCVVSQYAMLPEPARSRVTPGESDSDYEARLQGYPSESPVSLAIELRGGTIASLGVRKGDRVIVDPSLLGSPDHTAISSVSGGS